MQKAFFMLVTFFLLFISTTFAAEQSINATGIYIAGASESLNDAKQNALKDALRQATEQAGVIVNSYSKIHNMELTDDEVTIVANRILKITKKKFTVELLSESEIKVTAHIDVIINSDSINDDIVKLKKENFELAKQNQSLESQKNILVELNNLTTEIKKSYNRKMDLNSPQIKYPQKITISTPWQVALENFYIEMDNNNYREARVNIQVAISHYMIQVKGDNKHDYIDKTICDLRLKKIDAYLSNNDYLGAIEHLIYFVKSIKNNNYENSISIDDYNKINLYAKLLTAYFNTYEPDKLQIIQKITGT